MKMEAMEAIFTRRSIRDFTDHPVPGELLDEVLQAGVAAPSGGNLQAWGFVLVQAPRRLAALRALAPGIIGKAKAVIAICLDTRRTAEMSGNGENQFIWMDAGAALENMLLAAHSLGLGACPVGSFHKPAVGKYLDLPSGVAVILLLALGYPASRPGSPGRRPIAELVFWEKWGVAENG